MWILTKDGTFKAYQDLTCKSDEVVVSATSRTELQKMLTKQNMTQAGIHPNDVRTYGYQTKMTKPEWSDYVRNAALEIDREDAFLEPCHL